MTRTQILDWPVPVTSLSPVSSATVVWRRDGRLMLTVVVKATVKLVPGGTAELIDPAPIHLDERKGRHGVVEVRDLAPALLQAEVTAWGMGAASGTADVALVIGLGEERLLVKQTRAGGPLISCFAPILMSDRLQAPPTLARARSPLDVVDVSEGYDWSELQQAPADQRLQALRGDEWLATRGLHPQHPELATRLPAQYAMARLYGGEALPRVPLPLRLDSIHLLVHELRGSLVWRAHWPLLTDEVPEDLQVAAGIAPFGEILELGDLPPGDIIEEPSTAHDDPWAEMRHTRAVTDDDLKSMAEALPNFIAGDAGQPGEATFARNTDALAAFRQTRSLARDVQADLERAFREAAPFALANKGASQPPGDPQRGDIPGAPWSDAAAPAPAPAFASMTETVSEVRPSMQAALRAGARDHQQSASARGTSHWFPAVGSDTPPAPVVPAPRPPPPPRRSTPSHSTPSHSAPSHSAPDPAMASAQPEQTEAQRKQADEEAQRKRAEAAAEVEARQRRLDELKAEEEARARAARSAEERREAEAKRFQEEQRQAKLRDEERQRKEAEERREKARNLRSSLYSGMKRRS